MNHSSLFKENWFSSEGKKSKPALSNKNIKLRKQFVETYKEWATEDWEELYGVTKQKLTDLNPTEDPGIGLHPRIIIN